MSQLDSLANDDKTPAEKKASLLGSITQYVTQAISDADEAAAAARVASLQAAHPKATADELVDVLIREKCFQTGTIGAVTSGVALVPGLGTLSALTFGVAADIGMTFKMQAELVLEIAAAYAYELDPAEKRQAVLLVTGISAGANQVLSQAGREIAEKVTGRLAQKSVTRAIPVLGVAASAGTNALTTYIIGRRAQAYFKLGPEAVGDWAESLRAISGVDGRSIITWLGETTERSWQLVGATAQGAAGTVIVAGQSTGEVVAVGVGRAGEAVAGAGRGMVRGISSATGKVVEVGQWTGAGVAAGATAALEAGQDTAQWAAAGIAASAGTAGQAAIDTGKWIGDNIAAGAGAAAGAVTGAGSWIGGWFGGSGSSGDSEPAKPDEEGSTENSPV